ncbi:MAG: sulfotransferase [Gloeomargarita sp. GMQP_bins_120]
MCEATCFIIAGMHRSGTSYLAALLQSAGVHIGAKLLKPDRGNPRGYFENTEFLEFHMTILESLGLNNGGHVEPSIRFIRVPEQFVTEARELIKKNQVAPYWGWKDPRTTLFLDFWHSLLPDAFFIFTYRRPWEVVDSLFRRGDHLFLKNPKLALQSWMSSNMRILSFYLRNSEKCLLLNVETFYRNPDLVVEYCKQKFNIRLNPVNSNVRDFHLLKRIESTHRIELLREFFPECISLYEELNRLSGFSDDNFKIYQDFPKIKTLDWILQDWQLTRHLESQLTQATQQLQVTQQELDTTKAQLWESTQQLQVTQQELDATKAQLWESTQQLQAAKHELDITKAELVWFKKELERIHNSRFWKVWKVLRRVKKLVTGLLKLKTHDGQK